jgi:hypothetical protein
MIRRTIVAAIAAAAFVPLVASAPAAASTGPGCQGASCAVGLEQWIRYSGNGYSSGGPVGHVPVDQQPPPCLWIPIGDQISGSQYIVSTFGDITPANSLFGIYESVQQAKQLLKDGGPAGTWYNLPINPAAGPAGRDACLKLPAFYFVVPGQAPPLPQIPPRILAEYAYNHMKLPDPTVTVSPATKGFVNLATFVWWQVPRTMWVTAALPDGQAATVVARVSARASLSTNPAGAGTISSAACGPGGSRSPRGHPPATGAGVAPDCGVLWTQPAAGATVTVTVTWQVLFHAGTGHGFFGQPVPGAGNGITTQGTSNPLTVQEIQSINGG